MQPTEWLDVLLDNVASTGEDGRQAAAYLRARGTTIGFRKARLAVGAFWTMRGNIHLNARHYSKEISFTDPYLLSLVVHEVRHLEQGPVTALSVYGELDAWQAGFRIFKEITGHLPRHPASDEIMSLPLNWDREVLHRARAIMQVYAGKGYRVNWLPLYPLPAEIHFFLTRRLPDAK